ncbi:MAG: PIN domain-containing protein [Lachnospiraceae bacterium]|nr:PIN domain-containing protein [Lachnospiraceae bacterium]
MIYALDSNIISYMLKNDKAVNQHFENTIKDTDSYVIPPIVFYEVKRWLMVRNATTQYERFTALYEKSIKSNMTVEMWEKSIDIYVKLRTEGKIIDDADIFIASFCIVNGYTLITNNEKHFKHMEGLNIENWIMD